MQYRVNGAVTYTHRCVLYLKIIQRKDAVPGLLKVGSVLKGTRPVALMELVPLRRSLTSLLNKVLAQNALKGVSVHPD